MNAPLTRQVRQFLTLIPVLAILGATGTTAAQGMQQYASAGGVEVYYGFLPATAVQRQAADEGPMHGRTRRNDCHLMVALYDEMGERITQAAVQATVGEIGLAGKRKTLDPMVISDTVTFGNFFPMHSAGQYRVMLEIRLPAAERPVELAFDHHHRP